MKDSARSVLLSLRRLLLGAVPYSQDIYPYVVSLSIKL